MENSQVKLVQRLSKMRYLIYITISVLIVVFFAISSSPASALTTVPTKMNFQGRLADTAGNIKANGTYNMRLKLYSVSTGGSAVWSEDRLVSATQGVTVTNGTFSIQLGSITTLPASLFASGELYLEVELPTPASATTSSPVWTEGAMTPRNQMATSAYAYNAETLDGIDSAAFARTNVNNNFSGTQTVNVSSTGAFDVQNGSAVSVFKVDSATSTVTIGTASNGFVLTSNGLTMAGTARGTKRIMLTAEYSGAVLDAGSGANNTGSMTAGVNVTNRMNYYKWTTTQATNQNYDVVLQVPIPSDFDAWASANPINLSTYTSNTTNGTVTFELRDSTNAVIHNFVSVTPTATATWETKNPGTVTGTYTAGNYLTIRVRMQSPTSGDVRIGNLYMDYRSKF